MKMLYPTFSNGLKGAVSIEVSQGEAARPPFTISAMSFLLFGAIQILRHARGWVGILIFVT